MSFPDSGSVSCQQIPRSGIAGSDGSSTVNFRRSLHAVFDGGCAKSQPANSARGSLSATSSSTLAVGCPLLKGLLTGVT